MTIIFKKTPTVMRYRVHKFKNCFSIFSNMVKDRVMKFSGMINISIRVCKDELLMSAVTSGRHRKWKKKSKCSKLIFLLKTYTKLLGLFSRVIKNCPHRKLKRQLPVISKRSIKFSIFNAVHLLYYKSVSLDISICWRH
jgi:hypothetical protein